MYVYENLAWGTQPWHIFGLEELNTNVFESFEDLFEIFTFTHSPTYLLEVCDLVPKNRARVSQYTIFYLMWLIFRFLHWIVHKDFLHDVKNNMRWRVNVVRMKRFRLHCRQALIFTNLCFSRAFYYVAPSLEIIWVWFWLGYGILAWKFAWDLFLWASWCTHWWYGWRYGL